jgi:hypothetical protein
MGIRQMGNFQYAHIGRLLKKAQMQGGPSQVE